jgi:hypothetical protein
MSERLEIEPHERVVRIALAQLFFVQAPAECFSGAWHVQGSEHPVPDHQLRAVVLVPMPKLHAVVGLVQDRRREHVVERTERQWYVRMR